MELITLQPLWWLLLIPVLLLSWRYSLVDRAAWKQLLSLLLTIVGVVLLAIALCQPFAFRDHDRLHVLFLLDVSQSIELQQIDRTIVMIENSIDALDSSDSWSLFAFAADTKRFESTSELAAWIDSWQQAGSDDRFRGQTRLADAMLETRFDFPAERIKRIVVFSDGHSTVGDIATTIERLAAEQIDVRFNRIDSLQQSEAAIVSLDASTATAFQGEVVRLTAEVSANVDGPARLRLVHRGVVVQDSEVVLQAGESQHFDFDVEMMTPGDSLWKVELDSDQDHFPINNRLSSTINVRGKPRILILHQEPREMRQIERALRQQDFAVDVRGRAGLPESIEGLLAFDAIVLADFPATLMSQRQMMRMQRYVSDFGGGLVMLGSENSFGLGGFHRTPVEEVLPLVSRFEKEKEKPSLAMALVIDKSGSMQGQPIALARQAARATVELLSVRDQIAVIGFDGEPFIASEMRSAVEKDAIAAAIDSLDAGGGTNMYPAMVIAGEMLVNTPVKIRHMICLSDGQTQPADHQGLAQTLTDSGITISTVALGQADRQLMSAIAETGRGRYYETDDPTNVPQIFTRETMQASKSAIKEDLFGTIQTGDHPMLSGFNETELPFTLGYVMTQSKPTAQLLMVAETGDPLLAVSRFGLGVGLAWTSDWSEKWGGQWLAWNDVGRFWGQVLRSVVRRGDAEGITVEPSVDGDRWHLSIDRTDSIGNPVSRVPWEISVLDDQEQMNSIDAVETGLGRYVAEIPLGSAERLTARLHDPTGNRLKVIHYHQPYPAEYRLNRKLDPAIDSISPIAATEIRSDVEPANSRSDISHWFYLAALFCFLAAILMRRV